MQNIKVYAAIVMFSALVGCGGEVIGDWDEFDPRPTAATDLNLKSFAFSWLPEGNPIDDDMEAFTLSFGNFDNDGDAAFSISETGFGTVSGSVALVDGSLTFEVEEAVGETELRPGDTRTVDIETDETDGRIRLTREADGVEATSDPFRSN